MRARLLVVAVLVAAVGGAPAPPAAAAACEEGTGVTVVVDFASLGGGVSTDCAPGDPASGVEALRASGHEPTRAAQQPGYFVCRIDGKPADDPCQRASPEDAYWSYWTARPGGSWAYSGTGPAERDPAPGTVEGWAFGAGDPPSVAPPRERSAAAPSPRPSTRTPAGTSPSATRSPQAAVAAPARSPAASPVASSAAPAASGSPSAVASPPASSAGASAPPTPSASPRSEAVAAAPVDDDDRGSLAGPLAALGVLLLLAAGAAFQLQRRRGEAT